MDLSSARFPIDSDDVRIVLRAKAMEAGACACGFASAAPLPPEERERFDAWLAAGMNAGMDYMARYGDIRSDPGLLLEGSRTVMSLAFSYRATGSPRHPLFSDYALGQDYHDVLRRRLESVAATMRDLVAGSSTRICVDTAPVRERYWAVQAGLGFIGLNNCLIIPGIGSKVFLAEIFWTAEVVPDSPNTGSCLQCRRCIERCPGHALSAGRPLDARRCLSYLTIEHRGDLPEDLNLEGRRIYGCDVCQDVCPHNRFAGAPMVEEFGISEAVARLDLDAVLAMEQDDFSRTFRGSAVKRVKLSGLRRNAARAAKHTKS